MNSADLQDLMLAYVAGCVDADEHQRIEGWLASGDCSAVAAYAEALTVLHAVPLTIGPIDPPSELRDRLLKRCGGSKPAGGGMSIHWPMYAMAGLAACLAVALGLSLFRHNPDARNWQDVQRVMASPDVALAKMAVVPVANGTPAGGGAYGRVLYCPTTKAYEVHVFNLAPPPPGRVYELWLITNEKKPLPAGTFTVAANRSGMILAEMPRGTNVITVAITDEPEAGSASPTGKMQLTGNLAG